MIDIESYEEKFNVLQLNALEVIKELFSDYGTENIETETFKILGNHGNWRDKEILGLRLKFSILSYSFEAYLYYNQIEYHIQDSTGKTKAECNIEDFYSFDEMVSEYREYLERDILKLFPRNGQGGL
ncbi:hypothetical protein WIW50_02030 [Flavobacteriaceae bacterium 3-367]|uniref:hypothetical protein n=1 Tax=Eudoraea algarum TaxID=3417568 RepID=UPI0032772FF7